MSYIKSNLWVCSTSDVRVTKIGISDSQFMFLSFFWGGGEKGSTHDAMDRGCLAQLPGGESHSKRAHSKTLFTLTSHVSERLRYELE